MDSGSTPVDSPKSGICEKCACLCLRRLLKLIVDCPKIISDGVILGIKGIGMGKSCEQIKTEVIEEIIHDAVEYAEKELQTIRNSPEEKKTQQ